MCSAPTLLSPTQLYANCLPCGSKICFVPSITDTVIKTVYGYATPTRPSSCAAKGEALHPDPGLVFVVRELY